MIQWITETWPTLASLSGIMAVLGAGFRYGPKIFRRLLATLDCETDRIRWQERDRLRDGEILLLRRQVENLQADVTRLLERSVASGAVSTPAPTPASLTTILPPTSAP